MEMDWEMPAMRPGFPDHTEVDPSREIDDKPIWCKCALVPGRHKWNPRGSCPTRGPVGTVLDA